MLPMAKYAYNIWKHWSKKMSPSDAKYGFEPRTNCTIETSFKNPTPELYRYYTTRVVAKLSEHLEESWQKMGKYYIPKRKAIMPVKRKDWVMLNWKKIWMKGRCMKLEDEMYGLFKVHSVGKNNIHCKLQLLEFWNMLQMLNVSLPEWYWGNIPVREVI